MKKGNRLTTYIIVALIAGITLGFVLNENYTKEEKEDVVARFSLIPDILLWLIKMIVAPLVFFTLVVGVAKLGDIKAVGRIGGKTLLWFVAASLMSLILGMILVNLFKPGIEMNLPLPGADESTGIAKSALTLRDFLYHVFPSSVVESMA